MFSKRFMTLLADKWNQDDSMTAPLESIKFCQKIAYGIIGDKEPLGILNTVDGRCTEFRPYDRDKDEKSLSWDLRCSEASWLKLFYNPSVGLGLMGRWYATGTIKFLEGDYLSMIKNPSMVGPFLKHFTHLRTVWARIEEEEEEAKEEAELRMRFDRGL